MVALLFNARLATLSKKSTSVETYTCLGFDAVRSCWIAMIEMLMELGSVSGRNTDWIVSSERQRHLRQSYLLGCPPFGLQN